MSRTLAVAVLVFTLGSTGVPGAIRVLGATGASLGPAPSVAVAAASAIELEAPTVSGEFGEPLVFRTSLRAPTPPLRVELVIDDPSGSGREVILAAVEPAADGRWDAVAVRAGHVVPNTPLDVRFRVVTADGTIDGPPARHTVSDTRIEWRRIEGDRVTVWWHRGDEAFARRALEIAEDAIDTAAELLEVGSVGPVDFIVYSDDRAFRQAMGPSTRENVGGQAHPGIRTLFGLIAPTQIASDWVEELVVHELAHLVLDDAVPSPFGAPPRWLNEGLAVYLSTGYTAGDRAQVEAAARAGTIIPLDGLGGRFPTRPRRFGLAYAESVSAVDHLVETHGEDRLVALIDAFARGHTVDEAFVMATGMDFEAFDDAWLASVGAERPEPFGPRPAPPGPVPAAWESGTDPLLR